MLHVRNSEFTEGAGRALNVTQNALGAGQTM